MESLKIVLLSMLACVAYGVVHDQITVRICVEYFTIGHPPIFPTMDPTVIGLAWGILATWWVGAALGAGLAIVARIGSRPKRQAATLARPVLILLVVAASLAAVAGVAGNVAASQGWIWMVGPLADRVPDHRHVGFLTSLWMHNASYAGAFAGGAFMLARVWRSRAPSAHANATEPTHATEPAVKSGLNTLSLPPAR